MKQTVLEKCATDLAHEISTRGRFDIAEISTLIKVNFKNCLLDLIVEQSNQAEVEYYKLIELAGMHRTNSHEYARLGFKISAAKQRKNLANRAQNVIRQNDKLADLTEYVRNHFGQGALEDFYEQRNRKEGKSEA